MLGGIAIARSCAGAPAAASAGARRPRPPAAAESRRSIRSIAVERRPAARARDDPLLHPAARRPALHRERARPGAQGPLRDRAVRRRPDPQQWRQRRHRGAREPGDQPHRPRRQQAAQGRQDHSRDQARAAADLHPLQGPRRRRPHHRAVQAPGPLRRDGRAEDGPARPEPRRRGVRDQRRAQVQGPPDQHHRQRAVLATAICAARW